MSANQPARSVNSIAATNAANLGASAAALHSLASGAQLAEPLGLSAQVSNHLAELLSDIDAGVSVENIAFRWPEFVHVVEEIQQLRIGRGITSPSELFRANDEVKSLILLGADISKYAYGQQTITDGDLLVKTSVVPLYVRVVEINNNTTCVLGFRGTVGYKDLSLDANNKPITIVQNQQLEIIDGHAGDDNTLMFPDARIFHRGFFRSAQKLIPEIIQIIDRTFAGPRAPTRLLLTGHSLGGALAQVILFLSRIHAGPLSNAINKFAYVDCITFGTPPVSAPAIHPVGDQTFLSIINEGDIVPLAQTEYIKILIHLFMLKESQMQQWVDTNRLPTPFFKFSGQAVVLSDNDLEDPHDVGYRALIGEPEHLREALYANIKAHHMETYLERVKSAIVIK